jgi:hypothetical protein
MKCRRYWLGVVSKQHVEMGVQGGFAQVCHGKKAPLQRMEPGDLLVYYSPQTRREGGKPLRAFTAVGSVKEGEVYDFQVSPDFVSHRRDVRYFPEAVQVPLEALKPQLAFAQRRNWGFALRRGLLELSKEDFHIIAAAMGVGDESV